MPNTNDLFGQTFEQILSKVVGGSNQKFQLIYPYEDWWWPTAATGLASQAWYFANQIPEWSSIGRYNPADAGFANAYASVLNQVNLTVSPSQQQALNDASNAVNAAMGKRASDIDARNNAWTVANNVPPGVPKPEWATWVVESGWQATLAADGAAIDKANQTKTAIVAQQNPEYKAAQEALTPPGSGLTKAGWTTIPTSPGQSEPVVFYQIGTTGQDWVALLSRGGNDVSIELDASKSSSALTESWAKATASYNVLFWGVEAGGSWSDMNLSESDNSVKATIQMKATMVPVSPGSWYQGGWLRTLAEKPNAFNSPYTPTGGSSPIFGKGGILSLRVAGLVAGYQPSFTITMSQSTFNQHKSRFEASTGVRIGPFKFGGSGGHSSNIVNKTAQNGTFSGKSDATYPFIMGIIVASPGIDAIG